MFFFHHVPAPAFVHPTSFSGIFSEDDYVNMAQRVAHDYALANARIQAVEHQRGHYHHCHPHRPQHHPGGPHVGRFAPASLDNFCYGFGPAPARPAFFSPNGRAASHSPQELANRVWQQQERQHALNRRLEAIARQQEVAREREEQRRRALAEAAAREQQARDAHAARIHARQARDQEVLFALLAQMGLAIAPAQSALVASQVDRQQPSVSFVPLAVPAVSAPATSPIHLDRKGKGKAVDVPVEATAPVSTAPVPERALTLKEKLQARIHSETDPDVQASLVMLYSDLFDTREPTQPVAGPSGHKYVSSEVPISDPSSSSPAIPVNVNVEETASASVENPKTDETKTEGRDGAHLHRAPALPPTVAAKLLKFYRARRARRLSLTQIKDVEDALRQLEGTFEFPSHLDFIDRSPSPSPADSDTESCLAYTSNNSPVHAYEHALNDLLTLLDAVESNGDLEVRGRRKEVVKEIERALEAMERRIEESRERSRRGSVSSQVSDASATVTPYNVHNPNNVDEEPPVEVPAGVYGTNTSSELEDAFVVAEDASSQDEVPELVSAPTNEDPATDPVSPSVNHIEPSNPQLTVGIPDSGADTRAPSCLEELIHGDPSSPIDDDEGLDCTLALSSPLSDGPTPHPLLSAVDEAAVPASDDGAEIPEQQYVDTVCLHVQSVAVAADATLESDAVAASPFEPNDEPDNASLPAVAAPEAIARIGSSSTDATFITAEAISAPLSATDDSATFFTASTATPASELEQARPPTPAPTPSSESPSASDRGGETFLLSSTPLADEQPKRRRPSTSAGDNELEIIGREELEAARNDSDWSAVESESDLEVV